MAGGGELVVVAMAMSEEWIVNGADKD